LESDVEFMIQATTGVPIYQQLVEQICAGIARGRLTPDERLPSVRELSQTLVINPNTVARAYTELERQGTVYSRPGMGVFVRSARPTLTREERQARLQNAIDKLLIEAVGLGCDSGEVLGLIDSRIKQFQWHPAPTTS
jgi:GntR family transcriptional regulator